MLLVRARVGASGIHGLGLIAGEFIAENTVVWRFTPGFDLEFTEEAVAAMPPAAQEQIRYYSEYLPTSKTFVLSSDDDRFCNHSFCPNVVPRGREMVAVRDIDAGEEITCDYRDCIVLGFEVERARR